ncbi:MAG: hypothetical protein IJF58_04205 [Clostridia bacterium]|nr:hypothetical protein [Clostridia bacterium]
MRYPYLNRQGKRRVIIPQLSGGVNVADAPSYVGDNQLTDCNNMYFNKGRLRTRPPFIFEKATPFKADDFCQTDKVAWLFGNIFFDDEEPQPNILSVTEDNGQITMASTFNSEVYPDDKYLTIPINSEKNTVLRLQMDSNSSINGVKCTKNFFDGDVKIEYDEEIYIPTVLINNNGSTSPDNCDLSGSLFEGYNMLCDSYRMLATANGIVTAWKLPRQTRGGEEITVELYDPVKGAVTHRILVGPNIDRSADYTYSRYVSDPVTATYIPDNQSDSVEYQQRVAYDAYTNTIVFVAKTKDAANFGMHIGPVSVGAYSNSSSNMRVTVRSLDAANAHVILGMTKSCWFGGSRGGIGGGTRLFVTGNPHCPGAVYWSDLNRPTYFPENNYAYVGDSSDVTALAQQSDLLVIFQKNALTVSQYVQGETVTATDLSSGAVVDITTLAATFPMTPLHSGIGCDCPDTVQLCSNRLVWLNSNGKVYTLVSYGQYNERNVREVGYLIEPLLKRHSAQSLKKAKSVDVMGKYCLFIDDKVYLLDYESTAFKGYTSYAADKNAQRNMAWYVWTLPSFMGSISHLCVLETKVLIITDKGMYTLSFDEGAKADFCGDNEHPISCGFSTKHFIFGAPDRMKNIDSVLFALGKNQGQVLVECLSDGKILSSHAVSCDENDDGLLYRQRIYPSANSVADFSLQVSGRGELSMEGLTIIYKETGETV